MGWFSCVHRRGRAEQEGDMRLFNLFLRRAGVQAAPTRIASDVSRLTLVCPRPRLAELRQRVYQDFSAAGLEVVELQVDHAAQHDLASACVTVRCPPAERSTLMDCARQLRRHPDVRTLQWGDRRPLALN